MAQWGEVPFTRPGDDSVSATHTMEGEKRCPLISYCNLESETLMGELCMQLH